MTKQRVWIRQGDCIEQMRKMKDASFDSIVTDPPYELGFMGKHWDSTGIAYNVDVWREAYRLLKPGGHLLCFGGTRTYHRLACAIEDAGFEIRDTIQWIYGSGFPKSKNVALAIDKGEGHSNRGRAIPTASTYQASDTEEQNKLTSNKVEPYSARSTAGQGWEGWGTALKPAYEPIVMARKPLEGTVAANVLAHGTGAINIDGTRVKHSSPADYDKHAAGVAAIKARGGSMDNSWKNSSDLSGASDASTDGRWPANVILTHHDDCVETGTAPDSFSRNRTEEWTGFGQVERPDYQSEKVTGQRTVWACVDGCPIQVMDKQSGTIKTSKAKTAVPMKRQDNEIYGKGLGTIGPDNTYADSGGASRFFYTAKANKKERPAYYRASCDCEDSWPTPSPVRDTDETASPSSSNTSKSGNSITGKRSRKGTKSTTLTAINSTTAPTTSSRSRLRSTSASTADVNCAGANGGNPADSAANSNSSTQKTGTSARKGGRSTGDADRAILPKWSETSVCGKCGLPARKEAHATVKPIALMQYLVRLVTPLDGLVLDPFGGSGTTAEACLLEGMRCAIIEKESSYIPLIKERIGRIQK